MHWTLKIKDIPDDGMHLDVPLPGALLKDALGGPAALDAAGLGADAAGSHVEAHLDLSRAGDTISIHGRMEGDVKATCSRCLGEAHLGIAVPLRVVVGPESIGAEESVTDEIEYFTHDGEVLELETLLRETLIVALPMAVTCREDCKGLCPVCGGDRNVPGKDCGCEVRVVDPRLAALKDLKI